MSSTLSARIILSIPENTFIHELGYLHQTIEIVPSYRTISIFIILAHLRLRHTHFDSPEKGNEVVSDTAKRYRTYPNRHVAAFSLSHSKAQIAHT